MEYIVYYYDAFGREVYEEVIASGEEEAIVTVQESNSDGLYIPEIIAVERQGEGVSINENACVIY